MIMEAARRRGLLHINLKAENKFENNAPGRRWSSLMRFITYMLENKVKYGVLRDNKTLVPIDGLLDELPDELPDKLPGEELNGIPATLADFISASNDCIIHAMKHKLNVAKLPAIPLEKVKTMAPIPYPRRNIICLGKNYVKHAKEIAAAIKGGGDFPSEPVYFSKFASPAIGTGDYIMAHENITSCLDYEVELAVVIGKTAGILKGTRRKSIFSGIPL